MSKFKNFTRSTSNFKNFTRSTSNFQVYLPESRGHHVPCGLFRTVPDAGEQVHALELSAHSVVNTLKKTKQKQIKSDNEN